MKFFLSLFVIILSLLPIQQALTSEEKRENGAPGNHSQISKKIKKLQNKEKTNWAIAPHCTTLSGREINLIEPIIDQHEEREIDAMADFLRYGRSHMNNRFTLSQDCIYELGGTTSVIQFAVFQIFDSNTILASLENVMDRNDPAGPILILINTIKPYYQIGEPLDIRTLVHYERTSSYTTIHGERIEIEEFKEVERKNL